MQKSVLFLLNHAGSGGTERYVLSLAENMAEEGFDIHFAYNEQGPLADKMTEIGSHVFHIKLSSRFDLQAANKLFDYCTKNNISVVHTMFLREHYISVLASLLGNKAVLFATVHMMLKPAKKPLIWLDRAVFRKMDTVIAVCAKLASQLESVYGLKSNKLSVVHNGVKIAKENSALSKHSMKEYPKNSIDYVRAHTRKELGITNEDVVFITVGRFSEEKGQLFLIKAISELSRQKSAEYRRARFIIAGDGDLFKAAQDMIKLEGIKESVILTGFRNDIAQLLSAADVYISPSRTEAFSMAILEGMSAGLPIIATDVGGTSEAVNNAWKNGILIEYADTAALVDACSLLISQSKLRAEMAQNALNAVTGYFTVEHMAKKTLKLYMRQLESPL